MLAAIAIAAVTMSFKAVKSSPKLEGEKWFHYTNETEDGNPGNAANYVLANETGEMPPSCPVGEDEICGVLAQPQILNSQKPNLLTVIDDIYREEQ